MMALASSFLRIARVLVAVMLGLPLLLYLLQEKLIFHPQPLAPRQRDALAARPGLEEIVLTRPGDVRLHGWLVHATAGAPAPLVVYFGGNAEELSWQVDEMRALDGWSIALVNYRGYGASSGSPTEAALFADALAVYDYLVDRPDVDRRRVVAFGRSLGTGVAVYLARERPLAGVVLVSPFDSVRAFARSRYPFVPVDWLLRHPFDSLARAPAITAPVLALVAEHDRVVEPERAERLLAAWGGPARLERIGGTDHITIAHVPGYWRSIRTFLRGLPEDAAEADREGSVRSGPAGVPAPAARG